MIKIVTTVVPSSVEQDQMHHFNSLNQSVMGVWGLLQSAQDHKFITFVDQMKLSEPMITFLYSAFGK